MIRKLMAVAVLGLVLVWSAAPAAGRATRINFTGFGVPTGLVDPGAVSFPDGQVHMRGLAMTALYDFSVPELGTAVTIDIVCQANLGPPDMTGPVWCSFIIYGADGSVWEGVAAGQREHVEEAVWISEYKEVATCVSGPLEGAEYRAVEDIYTDNPLPLEWYGVVEGYLLLPGED